MKRDMTSRVYIVRHRKEDLLNSTNSDKIKSSSNISERCCIYWNKLYFCLKLQLIPFFMKQCFGIICIIIQLVACSGSDIHENYEISISPLIGRVIDLNFERDDKIGLSIYMDTEAYIYNSKMIYDGMLFRGANILWYNDKMKTSDVVAYYPYVSTGVPTYQKVLHDQTNGFESCDILSAVKSNVLPTENSLSLLFKHLMSKITISINNETNTAITSVDICGSTDIAQLNLLEQTASAIPHLIPVEINSFQIADGIKYAAILAPQTATLTFNIRMSNGNIRTTILKETTLASGFEYAATITISTEDTSIKISGDIEDWPDGGEIK